MQASNRRSCRYILIDGVQNTITEWCRIYNISPFTVFSRIDDFNWDPVKAITTPPRKEKPVIMMDKNGSIVRVFESANCAAKELGYKAEGIRSACSGGQKTYKNYKWKYGELTA